MSFSIGVCLDKIKLPWQDACLLAAKLGITGVQISACHDEPWLNDTAEQTNMLKTVADHGLVISALLGDIGGFWQQEYTSERIIKTKKIIDAAQNIRVHTVTTHIGVIPEDKSHERYKILSEACFELGEYASCRGVCLAIETGPETAAVLKDFIMGLGTDGIKANLDPANLVMVTGDDPVQAVFTLKDYIVHTHAKDGKMLKKTDPERIYGGAPDGVVIERRDDYYTVTPLGEGYVNFPAYLDALRQINYSGFLAIERTVSDKETDEIRKDANYLKGLI